MGIKKITVSFGLTETAIKALKKLESHINKKSKGFSVTSRSVIVEKLIIDKAVDLGLIDLIEHIEDEEA
jgi:hypothetical protein